MRTDSYALTAVYAAALYYKSFAVAHTDSLCRTALYTVDTALAQVSVQSYGVCIFLFRNNHLLICFKNHSPRGIVPRLPHTVYLLTVCGIGVVVYRISLKMQFVYTAFFQE